MKLFFSKPAPNAVYMARYLREDEGDLEMCWRMFKKLRKGQSRKRKFFLRKAQGIRVKTP